MKISRKGNVGAGIVSIITESLYDKPIVVFREYVQNAVDAVNRACSTDSREDYSVQIWKAGNNLLFLDNGTGITSDKFETTMTVIANSGKRKTENLGYKGIGRLSGISYCKTLNFINIIDYKGKVFQQYVIDCNKYREIQKSESYNDMDFDALMENIGSLVEMPDSDSIQSEMSQYVDLFKHRNTGFLVILNDITPVLKNALEDEQFVESLEWLLPVPFLPELFIASPENNTSHELFLELAQPEPTCSDAIIPAKAFCVCYNGNRLYRPIKNDMLRTYLCKSNLEQYAICVHTFSNKKIEMDRKRNPFSGIRIYIDNMLLCDENELIPALQQYGLIRQGGTYEVIQAVRGIGAMIYITDKVNISANARRTFIDVTDEDSFNFMALIGELVDSIYTARYALSSYNSAVRKEDTEKETLSRLRENALRSLEVLARDNIQLEVAEKEDPGEFHSLPKTDQKRLIKNVIVNEFNVCLKKYLSQIEEYNVESCFQDFKTWLAAN